MALQFESLLNAGINTHQANAIMDEFHDPWVLDLNEVGSGPHEVRGNVVVKGVAVSLNGNWADVSVNLPAYDGIMPGTKVRIANFTGDNTNGPRWLRIHRSPRDQHDIGVEPGDTGSGDSNVVELEYGRVATLTFEGEVYSTLRQGNYPVWTYTLSDLYEAPPPTPAYVNHMTTVVCHTYNNAPVIPTPTRNDNYYVLHYGTVSGHRNVRLPPISEHSKITPGTRMHFLSATNHVSGTWAPDPHRIILPAHTASQTEQVFFPTDSNNIEIGSLEAGHVVTITFWGTHRVHNAIGLTAADARTIWYWQETTNVYPG